MRKPDIYRFLGNVERKESGWLDWNGKKSYNYYVNIPQWLARAYNLNFGHVMITIWAKRQSMSKMGRKTTNRKYFKTNWLRKVVKMRKINKNYIIVSPIKKRVNE